MDKLVWIFISAMVVDDFTRPGVETPGYYLSPLRGGDLVGWGIGAAVEGRS